MALTVAIQCFVLLCVGGRLGSEAKWIDMSYVLKNDDIAWSGFMPFKLSVVRNGSFLNVPYVFFNQMELNEHVGTHIDAPIHFAKGQRTTDEIPIEDLIGPAVVVNISGKASKDRNAELTISDLEMWEKENGRIPDGSIVLMFSGWGKYWGDFEAYMGTKEINDTSSPNDYSWPGFHPDASQWLVNSRKLKGVGVDSRSLDHGKSADFKSHEILLGKGLFGVESVANLDKLPAKGATLYVMPMKIKHGSGGPARVMARIDEDVDSGSSKNTANIAFIIFAIYYLFF